ncbi:LysR family transcriptional regulator [Agrilactobacillus yilanensis]|uniref:LysR family transcriptional regulator n=1 Tax=Agrilactobacillus yilanensis TaxID=2485997 RepID=A0ABW4J7V1_9LACO|nr:LysR family transcriptional regulator [Agrilactobacillus yilanensis]
MELRVLRYFMTVVNERNISRAAEKLHISQPTISRQLKDLESELGVTLFERGSRSIELTPAGDYFANQARQILTLADKTMVNVQKTAEINGQIMIGSAEAPMMITIAKAIQQLAQTAPKVMVNIYSTDADDVYQRMQTGIFDFGVVMEPLDKTDYHFLNLPGTTAWGVLVRRDSRFAQQPMVTAKDLLNERLITPQQQSNFNIFADWFGRSDIQLNIAATYNLLYNASILASAGVGTVLCLDGIVNTANSNLIFVPLAPRLEARSSLIWPKAAQLSAPASTFLDAIRSLLPNDN